MTRLIILGFFILLFIQVKLKSQDMKQVDPGAEILKVILKDDRTFPNDEKLPLIVYRQAIEFGTGGP